MRRHLFGPAFCIALVGGCMGLAPALAAGSGHRPQSRAAPLRVASPARMQQQLPPPAISDKALLRRGWPVCAPHIQIASLLMSAVVSFFARLGGGRQADVAPEAAAPTRTCEPVILQNSLCERTIVDSASGHEFWVCQSDVEDEAYACRRTVKDGRWLWYCNAE